MNAKERSPGHAVRRALESCAEQAMLDLRRMETEPDHAIHRLRVRMKKIHALLLLVREAVPGPTLDWLKGLARKLRHAFNQHRDAHVMADVYDQLTGTPQAPVAWTSAQLQALRRKSRRLVGVVEELRAGLVELPLDGLTWHQLKQARRRRRRKGRHWLKKCADDPSSESMHRLRKIVKDLYYQTLALPRLKHRRRRLKLSRRLGSRLGHLHDLDGFISLPGVDHRHKARALRRELEAQALKTGGKLLGLA